MEENKDKSVVYCFHMQFTFHFFPPLLNKKFLFMPYTSDLWIALLESGNGGVTI